MLGQQQRPVGYRNPANGPALGTVRCRRRPPSHVVVPWPKPPCTCRPPLLVMAQRDSNGAAEQNKRRQMEDELRDPKNFLEYFLPRPLRLAFFGGSAASCFVASLLSAARLIQEPAMEASQGTGAQNLLVNLIGLTVFGALFYYDNAAGQQRIEQRQRVREAQIAFGDREVFVNDQGEKMSRLKEVNDDWILRRLERWGKQEGMPFLGPAKGALLQQLVAQRAPRVAVEVGTMAGYSAILMAQSLPPGGHLVSLEKDISWVLVAKRFLWQASQGEANKARPVPLGQQVSVWWGDASSKFQEVASKHGPIELLFLDGVPKETLAYLRAAEPYLAPGAMVVADNAGVFAEGGMKPYLQYVRSSQQYTSKFLESTLEWRDDIPDGMEVSVYQPAGSPAAAAAAAAGASSQASAATGQ